MSLFSNVIRPTNDVNVAKATMVDPHGVRADGPTVKLNIRGQDWELAFERYDRMSMVLVALIALENEKVDAVLKGFGVQVKSADGKKILWPASNAKSA